MKIAFIGSRGIPRCYSGFETFVEELSVRLVARGHEVTVYNRIPFNQYREAEFKGVRLIHLPTLPFKSTDTIVHSFLCTADACFREYDLIYYCGVGSSLVAKILKVLGKVIVINVDGADWERAKWSGLGSWWLRKSETWASAIADCVIADHPFIRDKYRADYGAKTALIPYGAEVVSKDPGSKILEQWGLNSGDYYLYVSRLTPENAADQVMEEYLEYERNIDILRNRDRPDASDSKKPKLVVVGDAPYQQQFMARLRQLSGQSEHIIMTGYVFGEGYESLSYHAAAFIYPTRIDATRPVVLDQMGFGNAVLALDTESNRWVVGEAGIFYGEGNELKTLADAFTAMGKKPEKLSAAAAHSHSRIRNQYDWDVVTRDYEELFLELCHEGQ